MVTLPGDTSVATVATPVSQQNYNQVNENQTTTTIDRRDSVARLAAKILSSQSWVTRRKAVCTSTLKAIKHTLVLEFVAHLSEHADDEVCARSFVYQQWPIDIEEIDPRAERGRDNVSPCSDCPNVGKVTRSGKRISQLAFRAG